MNLPVAHTIAFPGEMIFLGTGTSVGVPALGCGCPVCRSENPRNQRTRCAVALGLPEGNLLIDTPPDLRGQLLREGIGLIHAVLFTHEHADHLFGLDDVRLFPFYLGGPVPVFCEEAVERRVREAFSYAFTGLADTHSGATPKLRFHRIDERPFAILGAECLPVRLRHGPRFDTLGFRFGNVAYCTDTNEIPESSMERLRGLDVLILDAVRLKPHATHFSIGEAIEVARRLQPKRTILTHLGHEFDHDALRRSLPPGIEPAWDGMRIALS